MASLTKCALLARFWEWGGIGMACPAFSGSINTHFCCAIPYHTMNYPKKPGFNLHQLRHCAYITYSVKTWFLKFFSVYKRSWNIMLLKCKCIQWHIRIPIEVFSWVPGLLINLNTNSLNSRAWMLGPLNMLYWVLL